MKVWLKRLVWIAASVALALLVVRAFQAVPIIVDVATVSCGRLRVSVDDDGQTRVRERYTISAPIDGLLLRTALDPGDPVQAGQTLVAEFAPVAPDLLDTRSRREAQARINRAEAALKEAEARKAQAEAEMRYAATELQRIRNLFEQEVEPRDKLDQVERDERRVYQGLRAAEYNVQVARYELELARASLVEATPRQSDPATAAPDGASRAQASSPDAVDRGAAGGRLLLQSPIDGTVLRVFEESTRTMPVGTPILEVGNTQAIEIVADYLSQDAVKVQPGMEVIVEGWGGELPTGREKNLGGRVRVVEPGGFTKISALGVEEQRVNIVVDPLGDPDDWAPLGDGYRVELRIVLWEEDQVLIVPTGALFREGEAWAVFVVEDGRARRREVTLGRRTGLEAQVLNGLGAGEQVILYPSTLVGDGTVVDLR